MWFRLLLITSASLLPLTSALSQNTPPNPFEQLLQGQKPPGATPGGAGGGQTVDLGALLKKQIQNSPAPPKYGPTKTTKGGAQAAPGKVNPATKPGTTKAPPAGKTTAGKSSGEDAAETEKMDPSLLVSVPKREVPDEMDVPLIVTEGELTADRIQKEFQSIDVNRDGALSYLEARDHSQIDLSTFRRFDADNSGLLDNPEFEAQMVLIAGAQGQAVERTLKSRVDNFVEKRKTERDEEKAKSQPSAAADKLFEYYEKKLEGLTSDSARRRKPSIPRPPGLPPRAPRHPRLPAY